MIRSVQYKNATDCFCKVVRHHLSQTPLVNATNPQEILTFTVLDTDTGLELFPISVIAELLKAEHKEPCQFVVYLPSFNLNGFGDCQVFGSAPSACLFHYCTDVIYAQ